MITNQELIVVKDVCKTFNGELKAEALKNINLTINKGEFCSIMGPSGSGKSTLLHLLGALDLPTSGEIFINSRATTSLSEKELTRFRQEYIGLVFQFHFLLPEFTAFENLLIPQLLAKVPHNKAEKIALGLLDKVKILNKKNNRPSQMSGGEQQRVAIARSLVNDPLILLADEPTGNLDTANSKNIYALLKELNEEHQQTILVVTHDINFASRTQRVIEIVDGEIVSSVNN
jgi:lipoprotein-releasing system ATP-binding protein